MRLSPLSSKSALLTVLFLMSLVGPGSASADPTLTTLHSFNGSDGLNPLGGLVSDDSGALYGTTSGGGEIDPNCGLDGVPCSNVFKLTPPITKDGAWTLSVLHSFTVSDGADPQASLIFDKSGALYGTTVAGGDNDFGTVFRLTPPAVEGGVWTETVLHSFTGGSDGIFPRSTLIFDKSGALYGTTDTTVFKLSPPTVSSGTWTLNVLHSFTGGSDGANPGNRLIFDQSGALYGTTEFGGAPSANCAGGCGTVFRLTPPTTQGGPWTETVLHSFTRNDGALPAAGLIFDEFGALYGTTQFGGGNNQGTVFKLRPPARRGSLWTESVLHSFTGEDGASPVSDLIFDETGVLYGTASMGGITNASCQPGCGTAFKLTPPTRKGGDWTLSVLHRFTRSDGAFPLAGLIFAKSRDDKGDDRRHQRFNRALYSTTFSGGASCPALANLGADPDFGCGTAFKLTLPGTEEEDASR
jgi:uncharacterized repeat protein (TIGR03803 family)